mgnify:CR=1 FL=1
MFSGNSINKKKRNNELRKETLIRDYHFKNQLENKYSYDIYSEDVDGKIIETDLMKQKLNNINLPNTPKVSSPPDPLRVLKRPSVPVKGSKEFLRNVSS